MKLRVLLLLLPGLWHVGVSAQNCDKIVQKIEAAYRADRLDEALTQIRALRACDVSEQGKALADAWTEKVYKSVQAQKELAQNSLKKANRLIRHFNFDDEKAAWAYKDGLFAVIDLNGDTLTDFMYENPYPFNNGVAIAGTNNQYVFVNDRGEEVSSRYEYLITLPKTRYFSSNRNSHIILDAGGDVLYVINSIHKKEEVYFIQKFDEIGIMNSKGDIIFQPQFDEIRVISGTLAEVKKNGEWQIVNINDPNLLPSKLDITNTFIKGMEGILDDDKWGFMDAQGQIVVQPQFDSIMPFFEGMAGVKKGGKWGFIDTSGLMVIQPVFDQVNSYKNKMTEVVVDGKMGVIDAHGLYVFQPVYDEIFAYTNNLAWIKDKNNYWNLINTYNQYVCNQSFDNIEWIKDGFLAEINDIGFTFVDTSGRTAGIYFNLEKMLKNGYLYINYDGHFGIINKFGDFVVEPRPEIGAIGDYAEDMLWVEVSKKFGYIDINGKFVIEPQFDKPGNFENGLALVSKEGKWSFINQKGQNLYLCRSDDWRVNRDGTIWVMRNNLWGLIDSFGRIIVYPQFYDVYNTDEDAISFVVKGAESQYVFNRTGQVFELMCWLTTDWIAININDKWGVIDMTGQYVVAPTFDDIGLLNYDSSLLWIKENEKYGAINKYGQIIVRPQFENIGVFENGTIWIKSGEKYGTINGSGEVIVSPQFNGLVDTSDQNEIHSQIDRILFFGNGIVEIDVDRKYGYRDKIYQSVKPLQFIGWSSEWIYETKTKKYRQDWIDGDIDQNGRIIIEPLNYDEMDLANGMIWVKLKNKYGLADINGQLLVYPHYDFVGSFVDGIASVGMSGKYGLLDTLGHEILACQYMLHLCGYRLYLLEQNGRYGLFAPDYGVRIEPAYEELGFVNEENGWIRARKNGKWGWVDKTGQVKIPFRFDAAAPFKNGRARVLQLPYVETFYINEKGEMILGE